MLFRELFAYAPLFAIPNSNLRIPKSSLKSQYRAVNIQINASIVLMLLNSTFLCSCIVLPLYISISKNITNFTTKQSHVVDSYKRVLLLLLLLLLLLFFFIGQTVPHCGAKIALYCIALSSSFFLLAGNIVVPK